MRLLSILVICVLLLFLSNTFQAQNISCGNYHTQYICQDSSVMSWGFSCDGRIGRSGPQRYPGTVNIPNKVIKVASGAYHSIYLAENGDVYASGDSDYGKLGLGQISNNISTPQKINSIDSIVNIAVNQRYSLFLRKNGKVFITGSFQTNTFLPIEINNIDSIIDISAGSNHILFLKENGDVYGLGSNFDGQLGLGDPYNGGIDAQENAIKISSLPRIISFSAGENNSLFISSDSSVYVCGYDGSGQLGDGPSEYFHKIYYPKKLYIGKVIQAVTADEVSVFLKSDSTVWLSGRIMNYYTELTNSDNATIPKKVPNLEKITEISISLNGSFFMFEYEDSILYSMGNNHDGELGTGDYYGSNTPRLVNGLCGAPYIQSTLKVSKKIYDFVSLFPNPAENYVEISINEKQIGKKLEIFDQLGRVLHLSVLNKNKTTIDISSFQPGVFILRIEDNENQTFKLIKR